ncbi:uncharacterized protein [Acropora muricata]|uniref:uncharacterized protein n=2 Tax=Acropora TaxID=6127 RepID=UPI0034E4E4DD
MDRNGKDDNPENTKSVRERKQTTKGKQYQIQLLEDERSSAQRAWRSQLNKVESCLADSEDCMVLQNERMFLETKMELLVAAHEKLDFALDEDFDAKRVAQEKFETWERENYDVLKRLNLKITELRQEHRSLRSSKSGSSRSSDRSSRKTKSTRFSSSSSMGRKVDVAAQVAKLKTELMFVDAEAKRTAALKEQEEQLRKFKLTKQLALAQAEMEAISRVEDDASTISDLKEDLLPEVIGKSDLLNDYIVTQASSVSNVSLPTVNTTVHSAAELQPIATEHVPKNEQQLNFQNKQILPSKIERDPVAVSRHPSTFNPFSPAYVPVSTAENVPLTRATRDAQPKQIVPDQGGGSSSSNCETLERLADLLSQKNSRELLPLPEPETFRGDLIHYPTWQKSFDTIIERRTDSASQRLYYLGKYTAGDAKEAISGLLTLDSAEAYSEARVILKDRFGNPFLVAEAYRKKVNEWPTIPPNDGISLRKFCDFIVHCQAAMKEIKYLKVFNDPDENQKMVRKLPRNVADRWCREIDRWLNNEKQEESGYPPFSTFCEFLKREARIACNPVTMSRIKEQERKEDPQRRRRPISYGRNKPVAAGSFATRSNELKEGSNERRDDRRPKPERCLLCKNNHNLDECDRFALMSQTEKREYVKSRGLCLGCLKFGHMKKDCRGRKTCKKCNGFHPSSLHIDHPVPSDQVAMQAVDQQAKPTEVTSNRVEVQDKKSLNVCSSHSLIVPVWLHHRDNPEKRILVYALLDDQSDACFVKNEILQMLALSGPDVQLRLSTILGEDVVTCQKISGLVVRGFKEPADVALPPAYSREEIPAKRSQIPRPESVLGWPHLKRVANQLMPYRHDIHVGLLLGVNCARAIKPREIITGTDDDPYAKKTTLGWGVIGIVDRKEYDEDSIECSCNRIVSKEIKDGSSMIVGHFVAKTQVKEIVCPSQIGKMFEFDFNESVKEERALSFQDRKFLAIVNSSIHHREDRHYEIPLPLKEDTLELPNNKELALSRLKRLRQRLKTDSKYRGHYQTFMEELIEKGHAEKVPAEELSLKNGRIWYILHHGVYHPQKQDKIRVVFDASAEFKGKSLNRYLLQGPDLTNNLTGVLCRFRKEPIAFMCDVEGMFHQVYVTPEYRNFLRFLWWENGDMEKEPMEFRMKVHLFGAVSSPGCANFALKRTANDFEFKFGTEAAEFVRHDFYVDDGLKSVSSASQAIALIQNTRNLCAEGGFNLHKFVSNDKEVVEATSKEQRAKEIREFDMTKDLLPMERALGVQWCVESDHLQFRVELKDRPLTRRGILASVSSIYDPLGLVAPFLLTGKRIVQELCKGKTEWDEPVPDIIRSQWEKWRSEIHRLAELKIRRCHKPKDFGELKSIELHNFSDASVVGYGQCSYLRMVNVHDEVHCSLVMAKSRVTPLKPITVPRLELAAAVVSTNISTFLRKELKYDLSEVFWTDSKVVLGYVSNEARRFHTFVANRVQLIRDRTSPDQWNHVETKSNPADDASRGLTAQELISNTRWWNGPDFLWKPLVSKPVLDLPVSPDDPEVRKTSVLASKSAERPVLLERIEYFSDWHRAKKAIALCLVFMQKLKRCKQTDKKSPKEAVARNSPHQDHRITEPENTMQGGILVSVMDLQKA